MILSRPNGVPSSNSSRRQLEHCRPAVRRVGLPLDVSPVEQMLNEARHCLLADPGGPGQVRQPRPGTDCAQDPLVGGPNVGKAGCGQVDATGFRKQIDRGLN